MDVINRFYSCLWLIVVPIFFFGHCFKKQRSSNRTAPIYVSGSKLIDMPLFLVETYDDNSIVLGK